MSRSSRIQWVNVKEWVEKIKPGKEVVLSEVIVACSGLALMSSLIGPWGNTHALMIRPPTFDVQCFALFRILRSASSLLSLQTNKRYRYSSNVWITDV